MTSLTITGAYGRDYKDPVKMVQDLMAGKDFLGTNPGLGMFSVIFSVRDLVRMRVDSLSLRLDRKRKQVICKIEDGNFYIRGERVEEETNAG